MDFPAPLIRGTLLRRYKRFLADIQLEDGTELTVHCPNPGAMLGLNMPGLPVWLSRSDDPKRKLPHTLELVDVDGGLVGINTMHPNRLVAEGDRAVVLFVVQRTDCDRFAAAADCDPAFARALERVQGAGVEVYVYGCEIEVAGVRLASRIA